MTAGHSAFLRVEIPDDAEAEETVLGIVAGSPEGARRVAEGLTPEDFYRPAFGRAMDIAFQLDIRFDEDRRVALISSMAGLRERELAGWTNVRPRVSNAGIWVQRVKTAACRRRIMALAGEIYNQAAEASVLDLSAMVDELQTQLAALPQAPEPVDIPDQLGPRRTLGYFRRQQGGAAPS